jgi:AraC-like DNA-binding protein/mannose-6-phosphate isomerase-like protein (cupin superfamily)
LQTYDILLYYGDIGEIGMLLSEKLCYTARNNLDQHITHLRSKESSFYVHYWGATTHHFDNPLHKHSFFEVCYVIDGTGNYTDDGVQYPLTSGVIFCSRPDIWHQIRSETGLYLLFVAFEVIQSECINETVQQFLRLKDKNDIIIDDAHEAPTALIWRALVSQASQNLIHNSLSHLSHALLLSFAQLFKTQKELRQKRPVPSSSALLYQAKLFIQDNLSQPLRLTDVAHYLHISSRHLSRLFSIELGETFSGYIQKVRIGQASNMLKTTKLPIKYIAEETGFSSVHYFTRVFTNEIGKSPAQYRKNTG